MPRDVSGVKRMVDRRARVRRNAGAARASPELSMAAGELPDVE